MERPSIWVIGLALYVGLMSLWPDNDTRPLVCPAPPPVPLPPPPPNQVVIPGTGIIDNGKRHGGTSTCVTIPGLHLPAKKYSLDQYNTLCPAENFIGSALFNNYAIFESNVSFMHEDRRIDLGWFYDVLSNICGEACPCDHGFPNFLTGGCICQPGWTGENCDTNTCNDHGTWTNGACVCTEDKWDPLTNCARPLEDAITPTPCIVRYDQECSGNGICTDGQCLCTAAGYMGEACDQRCASPYIDNTICPGRNNWGRDFVGTVGNEKVYVCGGGYEYSSSSVSISFLRCPGSRGNPAVNCDADWEKYGSVCCSPGVRCESYTADLCDMMDFECCSVYSDQRTCTTAGCSWCPGNICAAQGVASDACTPPDIYTVNGDWSTATFDCSTDSPGNICNLDTRRVYLDIYTRACADERIPWSPICLAKARAEVNRMSWPRLSTSTEYNPSERYHVSIAGHGGDGCDQYYLSFSDRNTEAAMATWSCDPTRLYLESTESPYDDVSAYYIYGIMGSGQYCLVAEESSERDGLHLFNRVGLPIHFVYWRNVDDLPDSYCTPVPLSSRWILGPPLSDGYFSYIDSGEHIIVSPSHITVPPTPSDCGVCVSLGECSATDPIEPCLQQLYSSVPWKKCCSRLFAHTVYRGNCPE